MKKWLMMILVAFVLDVTGGLVASPAEAQMRSIRRAIQKNVQLAVRRQFAKLDVRNSAGAVSSMSLSPDGRYLATVSADRRPRVWDLKAGRQTLRLPRLEARADVVAFPPDGRSFITGDRDGNVIGWSTVDGRKLRRFQAHSGAVMAIAISDDGTILATGGRDRAIRVSEIGTGREVVSFRAHAGAILSLDIGPTGQFIVSGGDDGSVRIWELATGSEVGAYGGHGATVRAVHFGRDETEFYSAGEDNAVRFWHTDKSAPVRTYRGAETAVLSMSLDAKFEHLIAGTAKGALILWNTGEARATLVRQAHSGSVNAVAFDTGVNRVISAGADAITKIWDLDKAEPLVQLVSTRGGWAVVGEDGRFDGSDQALRDVRWVTQTQALPIDHFSEEYYEPGLLHKKRLGTGALRSLSLRSMKEGILPPPATSIILPEPGEIADGGRLNVTVVAEDRGGGIERVSLFHNGKVVDRANVTRERRATRDKRLVVTTDYSLRPVAGSNRFSAVARSTEKVLGMISEAEIDVAMAARPPRLHMVVVGINEYADRRLDLNYGVPDAKAIVAGLPSASNTLFSDFNATTLFDRAATQKAILQALDGVRATNPEDVVVIYMAGHGIAAGDEWYFLPYELGLPITRRRLDRQAVSSARLREAIARIEARRVFLLIDTCQSGTAATIFEDYVNRRALRRLGRSIGVHVLAATANSQQAAEIATLGHGVFTYSILAALSGKADNHPPDGNLTVEEIIRYAEDTVPVLSWKHGRHQQWPLVFSRGFNFTVRKRDAAQ